MESIVRVPSEMVKIIPLFDGDCRQLPLFIKKCEYILQSFQGGNPQNEYLFHVITSRLAGEAANVVGERDHINTWSELKQLLRLQFGDPRTEECLVLELESIKINRGESYLDFCHRIQHVRSILFAKLDETIPDKTLRLAKQHIYTNTSLNVFLYNLPSYLVRLVRLRSVSTLEEALQTVLEEQNFQNVYNQKNHVFKNNNSPPRQNFRTENRPQYSLNNNNNHNDRRNFTNNRYPIQPPNQTGNSWQNRNHNLTNYGERANNSRSNYFLNREQLQNQPQQMRASPPRQHFENNRTHDLHNSHNVASGSNTDVTMRTASSRRVNYTYNNDHENPEHNHEVESTENFHIEASLTTKG